MNPTEFPPKKDISLEGGVKEPADRIKEIKAEIKGMQDDMMAFSMGFASKKTKEGMRSKFGGFQGELEKIIKKDPRGTKSPEVIKEANKLAKIVGHNFNELDKNLSKAKYYEPLDSDTAKAEPIDQPAERGPSSEQLFSELLDIAKEDIKTNVQNYSFRAISKDTCREKFIEIRGYLETLNNSEVKMRPELTKQATDLMGDIDQNLDKLNKPSKPLGTTILEGLSGLGKALGRPFVAIGAALRRGSRALSQNKQLSDELRNLEKEVKVDEDSETWDDLTSYSMEESEEEVSQTEVKRVLKESIKREQPAIQRDLIINTEEVKEPPQIYRDILAKGSEMTIEDLKKLINDDEAVPYLKEFCKQNVMEGGNFMLDRLNLLLKIKEYKNENNKKIGNELIKSYILNTGILTQDQKAPFKNKNIRFDLDTFNDIENSCLEKLLQNMKNKMARADLT
jgi:hypothetical protein